jgi:hypothetical protein
MGQRHHLVPRFYLQRWSTGGKQGLGAIRRSTGEILAMSPRNAAVETDAYAIQVPDADKNYVVEKMLSAVESDAALALRRMLASWPPSELDKQRWSLLMALQLTRGLEFRANQNAIAEYLMKTQVSMDSRDPDSMRARLADAGLEPSEENSPLLRTACRMPPPPPTALTEGRGSRCRG